MNAKTTGRILAIGLATALTWSYLSAQTLCPGGKYTVEESLDWCARDQGYNEGATCGARALGSYAQNSDLLNGKLAGNLLSRSGMILAAQEAAKNGDLDRAVEGVICCQIHNSQVRACLQKNRSAVAQWLTPFSSEFNGKTRGLAGPSVIGRFADSTYFLVKPVVWRPDTVQARNLPVITVPAGFVFAFDSIPQVYYSVVRPDDSSFMPVVIHEYLYWTQTLSRRDSDEVFRLAMLDLGLAPSTVSAIYTAVAKFGQEAWDENTRLKREGEKRILKITPTDPTATWSSWKQRSRVFAD